MPADAYEIAASREINDSESPSAQTTWQVYGATGYINARAALDAVLPTVFTFPSGRIAYLDSIEADELKDDTFYQFTIGYQSQPDPGFNQIDYEFNVAVADETFYQSISTAAYSPTGKAAPSYGGAVGVQFGHRQPSGMNALQPYSSFSITKHWPVPSVTLPYQGIIESLVGAINNATFFGRAPGTVRFLGARGNQSGDKFPISYEFGFRPARGSYSAGTIAVPPTYGWDLHDVLYAPEPDATAKQPVWKPRAVYVHRVHLATSFGALAIE